jgi:hypothetical protein
MYGFGSAEPDLAVSSNEFSEFRCLSMVLPASEECSPAAEGPVVRRRPVVGGRGYPEDLVVLMDHLGAIWFYSK